MDIRSLWLDSDSLPYPTIAENLVVDTIVIGGGIAGLTTGLLLAREGVDVAVVEARRVGTGTTGHTTGKVTALQGAIYQRLTDNFGTEGASLYAKATLSAMNQTAAIIAELSIDCGLESGPVYTYAESDENLSTVEAEVEAARAAGLPVEFTRETELPFEIAGAVRLDDQLRYDAFRYCQGLAGGIVTVGGRVFEQSQVVDVDDRGDHFVATTASGAEIVAQRVVVATLLPFLDRGAFFAKTRPSQTYLTAYPSGASSLEGSYLSVDDPSWTLRSAGGYTLIGGESHRVGEGENTEHRYQAIEKWASERFAFASPEFRWSSHDYIPLDEIPYIGRMPRSRSELMVATGFRKWGLTNGTIAAMILRDSVLGLDNEWAEFFSATRLDAANSAADFVRDNAQTAKHFIADRFKSAPRRALEDLAPGEGAIINVDGDKIAAYRDPSGAVFQMSPNCPHMGCALIWNLAENTWDCPCHGSRFECNGRFITGPATRGMDPKD